MASAAEFNLFKYPSLGIVTCEHCGVKCSGGELHCNCLDIIKLYGSRSCITCDCWYETFKDVNTYYQELMDEGMHDIDATMHTHSNYMNELNNIMWEPCDKCAGSYRYDYECLVDLYKQWLSSVYADLMREMYDCHDDDHSDRAPWGGIR